MQQNLEEVGDIRDIELIATGTAIREIRRLRKHTIAVVGALKGSAKLRLFDGTICEAEVHWYECHGVGMKELKIKRLVPA